MGSYDATAKELEYLVSDINKAVQMIADSGTYPASVFIRAASLDEQSWMALRARLWPLALALLDKMCGTGQSSKPEE